LTDAPLLPRASRLASLVRTARPRHAFVLTRERIVYVGPPAEKPPKGTPPGPPLRFVSRALPADAFAPGPAGSPVGRASLHAAVSRLVAEAGGKITAASLVVPDDFVRILTIDAEEPEKRPKETEDVLVWRFGKTFGDPVPPLRLSWQAAGAGAAGTRVIALAVPEEAAASWESAFEKAGVRIGAVETSALAASNIAERAVLGDGFILWSDGPAATTLFFRAGGLRFLRTRETTDTEEALQDVRLAVSFVAGEMTPGSSAPSSAAVPGRCAAGPAGVPLVDAFRAFQEAEGGSAPALVTLASLPGAPLVAGATREEEPALLAALGALEGVA